MWMLRRVACFDVVNVVALRRVKGIRETAATIVVAEGVDKDVEGVGERVRVVGEISVERPREG
jgi:hypothetical protein